MLKSLTAAFILAGTLLPADHLDAATPDDSPRPVPLTRPEMKQLIEDVKVRTPRIPMPELSETDREILGEDANSYESAIRYAYLPWVDAARRSQPRSTTNRSSRSREQGPNNTLDYAFKTQLFWIVSRVNNCQYCIGHQESKLLSAGLSEEDIAALDGDWSSHTPAERAAFYFARTLSYEPHTITDSDIEALRQHFTDLQILEMAMSISRNNISNRWKEAIGVPQRADEGGYSRSEDPSQLPRGTYLTPTPEKLRFVVSKVAPVVFENGQPTSVTRFNRPALESWSEVQNSLQTARSRTARLPLVDEVTAREVLGNAAPSGPIPAWMLLLANFPKEGVEQIQTVRSADEEGSLSPLLKAQLAWIIARQDRAWYATGQAYHRLREAGANEEQIAALDGDWKQFSPKDQALFTVAKKLAASPVVLTDRDVKRALELAGPRDVVQTFNYTTSRAYFNRVTEAAGLPIDE